MGRRESPINFHASKLFVFFFLPRRPSPSPAACSHKLAPLIGSAALLSPLGNLSSSPVTTPLICLCALRGRCLIMPSQKQGPLPLPLFLLQHTHTRMHARSECCNVIPGSCKYFRDLTPPNVGRNWGAVPSQDSCLFTDITVWTQLVHF